jgi:thymidylate synthase
MNNLDARYQALLEDILHWGVEKSDRTGTGTISVFGRQIRHKMRDGFPLLTTKKMAWKTIVTELLWFLRGDTNIKFLVDNGCHIWDGDAYKNYRSKSKDIDLPENLYNNLIDDLNKDAMFPIDNPNRMLSQEEFINKIKTDDEFANKWGELGPIYGKQWRKWGRFEYEGFTQEGSETSNNIDVNWKKPIDQIQNLINDLKTNPDSRRLMVNAWNVGELDQMVLPPCHYGFQVYTRELSLEERLCIADKFNPLIRENLYSYMFNNPIYIGDIQQTDDNMRHEILNDLYIPKRAISLMWNQRSVDTFLGLPFNIASYGLLLEIIAKSVNMIPDELIGNLGDVHLYSNHIEQAKEQIGREPYELPKLNINTEFWATESGSCGEGLIDAVSVFEAFKDENFCKCLLEEDIQLYDYQSHPAIKAPLSN